MRPLYTLAALAALGVLAVSLYPDDPNVPGPPDDPNVPGPPTTSVLRAQALALCASYLPCVRGDAHYNEICKDFGGIGTTCGYLPAWMLFRLGCRDPRLVNRDEPNAEPPLAYHVAHNIAAIVDGGRLAGAFRFFHEDRPPEPGDVLYFGAVDAAGGIGHEHVAICVAYPPGGVGELVTYDLGHSMQPEGSLTRRSFSHGMTSFLGGPRSLVGVLDLSAVPIDAAADLSDRTEGVA